MAPEGFSGRFGSGSGEVTEGVRTLAGDFLLCFGMLSGIRTCCVNPLFVLGWACCNSGKRNEMKRVESRRNHVVSKCSLVLFF